MKVILAARKKECKNVVKKAWATRKKKYGESGFSKKGLKKLREAAKARKKS